MSLLQMLADGTFDSHIEGNERRYVTERKILPIINNRCIISRQQDLYEPKTIMCSNCDDEFSITKIELIIGDSSIITITDPLFFNFMDFIEDITINGTNYKLYHLDRTQLFFKIKLYALMWHEVLINITTTGNAETIKLNGEYTFLSADESEYMIQNSHEEMIKQFVCGNVTNYNSGHPIYLNMSGNVNGFILTDINYSIINSINLKLNNLERLYYEDKISIFLNTICINENTIYINLNNSSFSDNVTNSSLNTSRIDNITLELGLDEGNENINFKIGCYSNNIMRIMSGMGCLAYDFSHIIDTTSSSTVNNIRQTTSTWSTEIKALEGDDDCPVLREKIIGDYIACHQCKKNFDVSVKEFWIDTHHNCPMCRTGWENRTFYNQPIEEPTV
jgi:hypothetical protein